MYLSSGSRISPTLNHAWLQSAFPHSCQGVPVWMYHMLRTPYGHSKQGPCQEEFRAIKQARILFEIHFSVSA